MSPASKSKSKPAAKAAKEQTKVPSKASPSPSNGNSIPASAYNPISGTFHSLETVPPASAPSPQNNGRFRTIDETEDHSGSSFGTTAEYDSLSNNGSCSGESEDQKDKAAPTPAPRTDAIPGSDADKRDKIRQKNEKKHQRQRERRAQELHERCNGYLMSRKLEALAQQLVGMGFPLERATMALILNEGHLEQSVAWLFEGCEEGKQQVTANLDGVNLKIDIADELARIAEMEVVFKCTKQEVERAVVGSEGDLEKAAENLKLQAQKQESTAGVPIKMEDLGGTVSANGFINKLVTSAQNPSARTPGKGAAPVSNQQQRRDERDFNYTKAVPASAMPEEVTNRNLQSLQALRRIQAKPDWARSQVAVTLEKRWPSTSASPSVSYSLASPLQVPVPLTKSEARFAMLGNEVKTMVQTGTLREPVIVMQRPQSMNGKQQGLPLAGIGMNGGSIPASTGWHPNDSSGLEMMANGGNGGQHNLPKLSANSTSGQPYYPQSGFQPFILNPVDSGGTGRVGARSTMGTSSSTSASSTSLTIPSSLGLFTGWGSSGPSGSSSPVDWSTGSSVSHFDYTSIDWSLDPTQLKPERSSSIRSPSVGIKASRPGLNFVGLQDANGFLVDPSATVGVGSHEWTSPFAGKDLFRVPRQYVTSPSLQELGATWKA